LSDRPPILLDSGAYTAYTQGFEIDLDAYAEFLKTYSHYFAGCINLDVIGDGKRSYQNWKALRKRGLDIIPVYHMGTDEQWLEKYIRQTDYVAIGAIAQVRNKRRMLVGMRYLWRKYLLDDDGKPKLRIHGLGFSMQLARVFPWYSVDSSTPSKFAGHGHVFVPNLSNVRYENGEVKFDYDIREIRRVQISEYWGRSIDSPKTYTVFHALPTTVKLAYEKFFRDLGYEVGTIAPKLDRDMPRGKLSKVRALEERGIPINRVRPIIIPETTPDEERVTGLANSWHERLDYNLEYMRRYCELCPSPIIYCVLSSGKTLKLLEKYRIPLLISYWTVRRGADDPVLARILGITEPSQALQETDE